MDLKYNIDQTHQLSNESKRWIISYKKDRIKYLISKNHLLTNWSIIVCVYVGF
jgi:hypothetical protein